MKKLIALLLALVLALSTTGAMAASYTDKDTVKLVQQALNNAGYDCGTPDGVAGKKTYAAIEAYLAKNGIACAIEINDTLLEALGLAAGSDSIPSLFVNSWNHAFESSLTNEYSELLQNAGLTPEEVMDVFRLGIPMFTTDASGKRVAQSFSKVERFEMTGTANGNDIENIESVSLTFLDMPEQILTNFWHISSMYVFLSVCDYIFGATAASRSHVSEVMDTLPYDDAESSFILDGLYRKNEETLIHDTGDYKVTYKATAADSCDFTFTVYPPEPITMVRGSSDEAVASAEQAPVDNDSVKAVRMIHNPGDFVDLLNTAIRGLVDSMVDELSNSQLTTDDVMQMYELPSPAMTSNADGTSVARSDAKFISFEMTGIAEDNVFKTAESISLLFTNREGRKLNNYDGICLYYFIGFCDMFFNGGETSDDDQDKISDFLFPDENTGVRPMDQYSNASEEILIHQAKNYYATYLYSNNQMILTFHAGQKPATSDIADAPEKPEVRVEKQAAVGSTDIQSISDEDFANIKAGIYTPASLPLNLNNANMNSLPSDADMSAYKLGVPRVSNNEDGTTTVQCASQKTRVAMTGSGTWNEGFDRVDQVSMTFLDMQEQRLDAAGYANLNSFFVVCDLIYVESKEDMHCSEVMAQFVMDETGCSTEKWYADGEETLVIQTADYYVTYAASPEDSGEMTFTVYPGQKP